MVKGAAIDEKLEERIEKRNEEFKAAAIKNAELKKKLQEFESKLGQNENDKTSRGCDEESQGSEKILDDF